MALHPAFSRRLEDDYNIGEATAYYSIGTMTMEILEVASSIIEGRIKEIKSGNRKISIREMNKLNKQLYTVNKSIGEIKVRLEAFSVIFDNIDIGEAN